MSAFATYYLIDRDNRKVLHKSFDQNVVKELFDAYRFVKKVYLLAVISNGQPLIESPKGA